MARSLQCPTCSRKLNVEDSLLERCRSVGQQTAVLANCPGCGSPIRWQQVVSQYPELEPQPQRSAPKKKVKASPSRIMTQILISVFRVVGVLDFAAGAFCMAVGFVTEWNLQMVGVGMGMVLSACIALGIGQALQVLLDIERMCRQLCDAAPHGWPGNS